MNYIILRNIFTVDELLSGTKVKSPVHVYMPRKPRPNGHLIYFLGTKLDSQHSFILDIVPYLDEHNRPTPSQAFIKLVNHLTDSSTENITMVADSAFATKETLWFLTRKKFFFYFQ